MTLEHEAWTKRIIGAAIAVHRRRGTGFVESVYEKALIIDLHWFSALETGHHELTDAQEAAGRVECSSCGELIPTGASSCASRVWTWESTGADPT